MDLLRKQHERCLANCQQFVHLGSVAEALKFEKLVEECMKNIEILKNAYAKGQPVPKCHTEERTFNTVKIYSNLTLNEMVLYIIRGINLPAPSGVSPNDLDASVKFEFHFPSAVMDGRKATGGKLEVRVKIREPLSGVDLQPVTEKWLVLEPVPVLSPPERQKERYKLHSFSLLNYDRERLERKLESLKRKRTG
ncbi:Coiled-coil and C2 domain-containing protein 1A [Larimichthys crocea]|uniref:Uncharacterized protein n=1 Tax=Larimichthys crocea TaxID=215358 RepID=A0ACD3RXA8_LARCR|nr:Coiled-coil and C2 domain-containing protein 1A [Larimichthys crocea]